MNKQEVIKQSYMQAYNAIDEAFDFESSLEKSTAVIESWMAEADNVSKITTRQYKTNTRLLACMHLLSEHVAGFELDKDRAIEVLVEDDRIHLNTREFVEKAQSEFGDEHPEFARKMGWANNIVSSPYSEHIKEINANRFIDFLVESEVYSKLGRGAEFYVNVLLKEGIGGSQVQTVVDHYLGRESGFYSPEKNRTVATIESMYKQTLLEELPEHSAVTSFGIEFEPVAAAAFKAYYEQTHNVELEDVKSEFYSDIVKAGQPYRCGVDGLFRIKGTPDAAPVFVLPDYKMPHALSNGQQKAKSHTGLVNAGYIKQIKNYTQAFKDTLKARGIENAEIKSHVFQFGMDYLNELTDLVLSDGVEGEKLIRQMSQIAARGVLSDASYVHIIDNQVDTPDMSFEFENLYKPAGRNYQNLLKMGRPALDPEFKRINISDKKAKEASLRAGVIAELIDTIEHNNDQLAVQLQARIKSSYKSDYGRAQYSMRKLSSDAQLAKLLELDPDFDLSQIETTVNKQFTKLNTDLVEVLANRLDIHDKLYERSYNISIDPQAPTNVVRNNLAATLATETDSIINEYAQVDYKPEQSVTPKP